MKLIITLLLTAAIAGCSSFADEKSLEVKMAGFDENGRVSTETKLSSSSTSQDAYATQNKKQVQKMHIEK